MKVAVLGASGQLGRALSALLPDAMLLRREDLDIADAGAVSSMDWSEVDVIVNAAAYTSVDTAESPEGRVAAWRANATGVANLARAANQQSKTLVHVSSEYVFDGRATQPIREDAPFSPLSAYGASKAAGDIAASLAARHYIIRTTWVTGNGSNFVRTMLGLATKGIAPSVVSDQIGRLTFADDLAMAVIQLVTTSAPFGTYNVTSGGEPASWADVARAVFEFSGRAASEVTDTTTAQYYAEKPHAAPRPLNSVLDLGKATALGLSLPHWHKRLHEYIAKETQSR
jgi:dTDP-4-dehydrorhamnose 3,5-epimerase